MKTQQEAERAEQQRIKNLVLNYDLQESNTDQDGIDDLYSNYSFQPNPNLKKPSTHSRSIAAYNDVSKGLGGGDKHSASHHQHNPTLHQSSPSHANARPAEKSGTHRNGQRARKLQLSDVDWYEQKPGSTLKGRGRGVPHRTTS